MRRPVTPEKVASDARIRHLEKRAAVARSKREKWRVILAIRMEYELQQQNGLMNACTYTLLIRALGAAGEVDRALELYRQACLENFQDRFINAAIICALQQSVEIGNTAAFNTLYRVYHNILAGPPDKIDSYFFYYAIVAANQNKNGFFANTAYEEAVRRQMIDGRIVAARANAMRLRASPPTYEEAMCALTENADGVASSVLTQSPPSYSCFWRTTSEEQRAAETRRRFVEAFTGTGNLRA